MQATIESLGNDILCRSRETTPSEIRLDGEQARTTLEAWAVDYDTAVRTGDAAALLTIGRAIFRWLDDSGWAAAWMRASGPRSLEIRIEDSQVPLARALLDTPWELLATQDGHLADDAVQLLEVVRRIGAPGDPIAPHYSDLQLMFMTAAPAGQTLLDFEAEEVAILEATERLPLHLVVEESGTTAGLGERLDLDGPFEALHLSCHGDIHVTRGPVLALEDTLGELAYADPAEVTRTLGEPERTPLVFLSACRSAEQAAAGADGARQFAPFVRELVRAGVANVLGWDGSVYDADAMAFATTFYGELAGRERIPRAVALARQALRRSTLADPQRGQHWHLARLYLGPKGGGVLAAKGLPKRKLPGETHEAQFLDAVRGEVPVATRAQFVGRRRQIQAVLRAFGAGHTGVLIHGMGNLGKSSLAARVASRMTGHRSVVLFRRYDALAVFDRMLEALPAQERSGARATWREAVQRDPATLSEGLESVLEGPLDTQPILLIVDDLERILETPGQSASHTLVQETYRTTLTAILTAFARAQTASRLLLTSRYRFTLSDGRGGDLADGLVRVPLQPMDAGERVKQLRAAARAAQVNDLAPRERQRAARAVAAAGGNPGLQAALMTPILRGESAVADQALQAIESYQRTGEPPLDEGAAKDASNAILTFFRRMAFETYRAALTPDQAALLRAACVFTQDLPIPHPALTAAGRAAGVQDPEAALERLLGLGLADDWGRSDGLPQAAINPLARPLLDSPDAEQAARIGAAALTALARAWRLPDNTFPQSPRAEELARIALAAVNPDPDLLGAATESAGRYLFAHLNEARRAHATVLQPALVKLQALGAVPTHGLLLIAIDCAERLGETTAHDRALTLLQGGDAKGAEGAAILLYQARRHQACGALDEAIQAFEGAALGFRDARQDREWAIARSGVADILQARGELDAALRIRTDEQLPVYERLGDVREKAVTQGYIADILQARGQLDEALRIRTDEELPVYERLGDVRSAAVTRGKIADILQARGQLDEALRIRTEEQLPVYERLGDVRAAAVTRGKIADILQARGQLDEALRIRTEEVLPAFVRLGDPRLKAVEQGRIADILQARGQLDEALRIRNEEELPVYERLGDVRELLVCRAKIALTLLARGRADDRAQANTLLCLALAAAQRLRLSEASQIEQILQQVGMDCSGLAGAGSVSST